MTICFVQVDNEDNIIACRHHVSMVTFTNPFSVAVRGLLTIAGSGLLEEKVLIKYVKSFSVQSQFTAVLSSFLSALIATWFPECAAIMRTSLFFGIKE